MMENDNKDQCVEAWEVWPVKVQGGEGLTESRGKTVKEDNEIGLLKKGNECWQYFGGENQSYKD